MTTIEASSGRPVVVEDPDVASEPSEPDEPGQKRQSARHRQRNRPPRRQRSRTSKPRSATPLPPGTQTVLWMLVTLGLLAVWFVAYALGLSGLQERADQRVLYGQLREQLALATAPVGGAISPGAPVAVLQIPALGVSNDVVVEGTSSSALRLGPGHRRDTPLPGQAGVSLVYGRSVTFGAPFRNLSALGPKDTIVVTTGQGEFTYVVDAVRRPGDPLPPPPAADQGRLTLVSAEGSGRLASFTASDTVFVDATMQGKVQPIAAGRPASVGDAETSMGSDTSGLIALVLWLEALVLVAVGVVWAARRWGGWQTWVVSVPVVLAVLWGTTSVAFGLLPNLL